MNVLFVGGNLTGIIYNKIAYQKSIINKNSVYSSELVQFLNEESIKIDKVIIIDEGIDEKIEDFVNTINQAKALAINKQIVLLTRNIVLKDLKNIDQIIFSDQVYITYEDYEKEIEQIIRLEGSSQKQEDEKELRKAGSNKVSKASSDNEDTRQTEEKKEHISLFAKFRRNKEKEDKEETKDKRFGHISSGISRVIAVTGHRGAGITSSVVNLATQAAKKNLSTVIVDMDIYNRTTNLYFGEFIKQVAEDEHMSASLIKCLAKPQEYKNNACNIEGKLWLTGLGYGFEDRRLIEQFYTPVKLINMITILKQSFNVVILDIPLDILQHFNEVIMNIDVFALCVNNSQYSVITTLQNMGNYFSNEEIGYINAKTKLLITKYNDRAQYEGEFFTPDRVSDLFASDLCEEMNIPMPVAGYVRYYEEFDSQMERDIPISEISSEYKEYYVRALVRLLEGGK